MQRPAAPGGPGLGAPVTPQQKNATGHAWWRFVWGPQESGGGPLFSDLYLVLPLAGVPGAVDPEFETAALASGVGMGLVPLLGEGVDGEEEVEGLEPDGVAPVSSTFFPQAPSASKADRARAVAAAGLNWDASMSVSLYEDMKGYEDQSVDRRKLAGRQPDVYLAAPCGYAP